MFGAGGGTSSYREIEETEVIILWGSNARDAHPIFFHHLLKGVRNGAKLFVVDPRRTSSAQWADLWLGIDVGTDIALANAIGREIIAEGLQNDEFIRNSTLDFDQYKQSVEPYTLAYASKITSLPEQSIRELAHTYAQAKSAQLCWTLGITEHHNATDNVLALINLSLLTGHVGRWGSGVVPLRGQNNVQGGGDMGALPNKLPGFQDITNKKHRAKFEKQWRAKIPDKVGWHLSLMFEAMERNELRSLYIIGENPAQSEADVSHAIKLLQGLKHLVVQDMFLTKTAQLADVVFPASASFAESNGSVTSSERRVQRVRKALEPPGDAKEDIEIISLLSKAMGHKWPSQNAEEIWNEIRALSPMHAGMSYERLENNGGLQWPCLNESDPGSPFLHGRLWKRPIEGPPAPFTPVEHVPPIDPLNREFPLRLTTGRRLDSYNTGVQTGSFASPLRKTESLDISPSDGELYKLTEGQRVRITSRRGSIEAPIHLDNTLKPGLVFLTVHSPDEVDVNQLTTDTWDPKSGTAEFKATAIRIEPI